MSELPLHSFNPVPASHASVRLRAVALPHGITLSLREAGPQGGPVVVFLHGFPEAAFVWDALLAHFGALGFHAVAPNLRGYECSSAPPEVAAYRAKHLVQDISALAALLSPAAPLHALVAHDWGGAVAWNAASTANPNAAKLMQRLVIVNSPHPGTFARELANSPEQQAASAYMNFLCRADAPALLAENDFARLWPFFTNMFAAGNADWLTEDVKARYRHVWQGQGGASGLVGPCHYYTASPLRPPTPQDAGAQAVTLPPELLNVSLPTQVIWGMADIALPPALLSGLEAHIPRLRIDRVEGATHWIVHEQPEEVAGLIESFLAA